MMSSQWELEPTAGRLQPDEEVNTPRESHPHQQGGRLRKLIYFSLVRRPNIGDRKRRAILRPHHSTLFRGVTGYFLDKRRWTQEFSGFCHTMLTACQRQVIRRMCLISHELLKIKRYLSSGYKKQMGLQTNGTARFFFRCHLGYKFTPSRSSFLGKASVANQLPTRRNCCLSTG